MKTLIRVNTSEPRTAAARHRYRRQIYRARGTPAAHHRYRTDRTVCVTSTVCITATTQAQSDRSSTMTVFMHAHRSKHSLKA